MMELSLVTMWILAIISIALIIASAYIGATVAFFISLMNAIASIFIIMEETK